MTWCDIDNLMGVVIIKWVKKVVKWALKIIKIGKIFMFYHLKPWQSWQVDFFFIHMNVKKFKPKIHLIKFWFRTFKNEHLLCHIESILQRTIKRIHIIKQNWWEFFFKKKPLLITFKKRSYLKICEILKL